MRISSAFPSDYLKASDLQGRQVTVSMARVAIVKIGNDQKPVLYFQGKQKGMVLNKTNSKKIVEAYGEDTDGWTGRPIVLFEAMVDFQGETVPAIRVRVSKSAPQNQAPPPARRPPADEFPPEQRGDAYDKFDQQPPANPGADDIPF
jgi:hypothetical protein